jgi:hydrogenase/urease accessory protein HupE
MRGSFALVVLAVFAASAAGAHMLAPSLLQIRELDGGRLDVEWRTPIAGTPGAELRPVLPSGCEPTAKPSIGQIDAALVTRWPVACSMAGLVGRRFTVAGIVENRADVLLRIELADGRRLRTVLGAEHPQFVVPDHERPLDVFASYLRLGVEHILTGFDHLLFVLGLCLLISGRRLLLWTLTSFTVGHSVTLSLAALGFVHVPQAPAEAAIAVTIFVLARELARPAASPTLLRRRPWAMAALFGLLHGLGFAGALAEIGLPQGDIPLALFSFNVGIEIGQIAFVIVVVAVRAVLERLALRGDLVSRLGPAYAIGALSAFWIFERIAAIV